MPTYTSIVGWRISGLSVLLMVGCSRDARVCPDQAAWDARDQTSVLALAADIKHTAPTREAPRPWEEIYLDQLANPWAERGGLYSLSKITLPEGVSEVRVWRSSAFGMTHGIVVQE